LAEDLAIEILASYSDEDFADADLSRIGSAAVYLSEYDALGPSFQQLPSSKSSAEALNPSALTKEPVMHRALTEGRTEFRNPADLDGRTPW
jgi:hypothetical protein